MSENPVTKLRHQLGLTLEKASKEAGVHLQAFFLQEQGVFGDVIPAIRLWMEGHGYDLEIMQVETRYHEFQRAKRVAHGERYGISSYTPGPPVEISPFRQFRDEIGITKSLFAKSFCVHTGVLYRLEIGLTTGLPSQIRQALQEAGMSPEALNELDYRVREDHEWH